MNASTAVQNRENVLGLLHGKEISNVQLPQIRAKSRAFANVGNVQQAGLQNNSKATAAERQRLNAEKLSKGYSVVFKSNNKENRGEGEAKDLKKVTDSKKENSFRRETDFKRDTLFKQPQLLKSFKQKKQSGCGSLTKSSSLSALNLKVKAEVKAAASVSDLSSILVDFEEEPDVDEFTLGTYVRDIYKYLRSIELEHGVREHYISMQHIMTESMREVLVDWMYEVQLSFHLLQDTTQMAIALLDRYMQETPRVPKDELQLVAVTCIFIASKYEEMYPPHLDDLVTISANACSKSQILRTEIRILKTLKFDLGRPPPIMFLRRFCRASQSNSLIYSFSKYFTDLALVQYRFCHHPPSFLSAAALYLAIFVTSKEKHCTAELWSRKLAFYSGYSFQDICPVVYQLAKLVVSAPTLKQRCVSQMYADGKKLNSASARLELTSSKLKAVAAKASDDNSHTPAL